VDQKLRMVILGGNDNAQFSCDGMRRNDINLLLAHRPNEAVIEEMHERQVCTMLHKRRLSSATISAHAPYASVTATKIKAAMGWEIRCRRHHGFSNKT
jgi:hypothetical protein